MDGVSTSGPGLVPHHSDALLSSLQDVHLVLEILGADVIEDLMEETVQAQLLSYDKLGREGGPLYSLDKDSLDRRSLPLSQSSSLTLSLSLSVPISLRWSGLRRLLYAADQRMKDVFPPSWMFSHRLYLDFCDRTTRHLKSLLDEDMARYRSVCTACILARAAERGDNYHHTSSTNAHTNIAATAANTPTNTTDALATPTGLQETQEYVSRLVVAMKSVLAVEEEMSLRYEEDMCSLNPTSTAEEEILGKLTQGCMISTLFDEYMTPYVQLERKNLDEIILELISQDDLSNSAVTNAVSQQREQKRNELKLGSSSTSSALTPSSSGHSNRVLMEQLAATAKQIYDSGGRLFETIRQSLKRCLALTTSKPLYLLSLEYCGCIEIYSYELLHRCPTILHTDTSTLNKSNLNVIGGNKIPLYRLPLEDEITLCRVINTAEYCCQVIPNLENQIKLKIKISYENLIHFQKPIDLLTDVIATSVNLLVNGILSLTDGSLRVMKKINWSSVTSVGDESSYVTIMKTTLGDCIPRLRNSLSHLWFQNFCLKYSIEFLKQYLNLIMRQKKINSIGAEQLLLDTNAMKTLFMNLHHVGLKGGGGGGVGGGGVGGVGGERDPIPSPYLTVIGEKFQHLSIVLKLLCVPEDQFEEMCGILYPEGTVNELQAIYELKHNPSMISSTANAVGDISAATTRVAVGGTKSAFGATTRAFEASTKAIGGSMSKTLATMKIATTLKNKSKRGSTGTMFGGEMDGSNSTNT
jgi:hypothetical protein